MVLRLQEADDSAALEASARLRAALAEWLTVPIEYAQGAEDLLAGVLGDAQEVEGRWGQELRMLYEAALRALREPEAKESRLRSKLRAEFSDLHSLRQDYRVFCHPKARCHFESIVAAAGARIADHQFFHSVRDYRDASPFEVLVKVGPLRPRGWGAVPDAVITAPRFETLLQLVWAGSADDSTFGYDPVEGMVPPSQPQALGRTTYPGWQTRVLATGIGLDRPEVDHLDDFAVLAPRPRGDDRRTAVVVHVAGNEVIAYPPTAPVLSFAPSLDGAEAVGRRIPGESLLPGHFVILPDIGALHLADPKAKDGALTYVWKKALDEARRRDPPGLVQRLRRSGVHLVNLHAAISLWCSPPTTVIHAPKQSSHFRCLVRELGLDHGGTWWKQAWAEIRRSRGEAVQAGLEENALIEEELVSILEREEAAIRALAVEERFSWRIPERHGLAGTLHLLRVVAVETGQCVPAADFKQPCDPWMVDQWRE